MAKSNRGKKGGYSTGSFRVKEEYKSLRTNIQFLLLNEKNNIIVFTSGNVGEGKSTTAVNTAITMVESGAKVLLIDADLRRPVLHKMMDVNIVPGVTSFLSGKSEINEVIRHSTYPRLDICTSGAIPPNPAELIGSEKMIEFLEEASKRYDYVFIDTPPITVVTDSLALSKHVAGYIFVVRQYIADTDTFRHAVRSFELVDAKILGIVFNDVNTKERSYGYYSSRYGKKYGYGKYGGYYGNGYYGNYYSSDQERLDSIPEVVPAVKTNEDNQ